MQKQIPNGFCQIKSPDRGHKLISIAEVGVGFCQIEAPARGHRAESEKKEPTPGGGSPMQRGWKQINSPAQLAGADTGWGWKQINPLAVTGGLSDGRLI